MKNKEPYLYQVFQFLAGTFHQDMGSPEEVLQEFIDDCNAEQLLMMINECEQFLNSYLTDKEKENFIEENAEIYFPAIGLTPLEWFIQIIQQMQEALTMQKGNS